MFIFVDKAGALWLCLRIHIAPQIKRETSFEHPIAISCTFLFSICEPHELYYYYALTELCFLFYFKLNVVK